MQQDRRQSLDGTGDRLYEARSLELSNSIVGNKYIIKHKIGRGSHSTIYYGLERESRQERAFKYYNFKHLLKKKDEKQLKYVEMIIRISKEECKIMKRSNSINTVKCYDVYENQDHKIIVMEYCNEGTLKTQISRNKMMVDESVAVVYLKQIVDGVNRLNSNFRILLTNLKLENVMVSNGVCKLIDFGFFNTEVTKNTDIYVPQIYQGLPYNSKAQVWCIGALFYSLLLGETAYFLRERQIFEGALKSQFEHGEYLVKNFPETVSVDVKHFLQNALITKTQNRMSWKELQNHPVFRTVGPDNELLDKIPQILPIFQTEPTEAWTFRDEMHNFEAESLRMNNLLCMVYKIQQSPLQVVSEPYATLTPNRSTANHYNQTKQLYLQFLIKHTIFKQLVEPLQSLSLINIDNKEELFFMYLLIIRLCTDLNSILERNNNRYGQQSPEGQVFKNITLPFVHAIQNKWQKLRNLMMIREKGALNLVTANFSKLFFKGAVDRKNKFFAQMQGEAFSRQEQVLYTHFHYLNHIQKDLMKNMQKSSLTEQQILKLASHLQNYPKLCNLTPHHCHDHPWTPLPAKLQQYTGIARLL